MLKNKVVVKTLAVMLSTIVITLLSNTVQARGVFPTVIHPGQCTQANGVVDPNITTTAVLRKSSGIWYFSMETVGSNSVGKWLISSAKNNVWGPASSVIFSTPGNWAVVGGTTTKLDKGIISFAAKAVNTSLSSAAGDYSCYVTISITL